MGCTAQTKADSGRFTVIASESINSGMGWLYVVHDNQYNVTLYGTEDGLTGFTDSELRENLNKTSHGGGL